MSNKPQVFFVTGVSGAGKTTLLTFLRKLLSETEYDIRDIDEEGVPSGADKTWRITRTEQLLKAAEVNATHGISTIICGVTVPSEVEELHSSLPTQFLLLDIADETIGQRLRARFEKAPHLLNTAAPKTAEEMVKRNINFARFFREEFQKLGERGTVIETLSLGPEEVAQEVARWAHAKLGSS